MEQAATDDERRGAWQVARPRVTAAEDQLAVLGTSAPDEASALQVSRLTSGVAGVRESLDAVSIASDPSLASQARGQLTQAQRALTDALPPRRHRPRLSGAVHRTHPPPMHRPRTPYCSRPLPLPASASAEVQRQPDPLTVSKPPLAMPSRSAPESARTV